MKFKDLIVGDIFRFPELPNYGAYKKIAPTIIDEITFNAKDSTHGSSWHRVVHDEQEVVKEPKKTLFRDVPPGKVFMYLNERYIRIAYAMHNAFCIDRKYNNKLMFFDTNEVEVLDIF